MYRSFDFAGAIFEWDEEKEQTNFRIHGIHFQTAVKAFADPNKLIREDEERREEKRYNLLCKKGKILFAVFTFRNHSVRLISARLATGMEKARYEQGESFDE